MTNCQTFACEGDKISAYIDGVDYTARIHRDDSRDRPDERQDGFWPSKIKTDAGYVKPELFDAEMKKAKSVMKAWKNDEWFYCGIVLSVEINDELIKKNAESLWGIECNYPTYHGAHTANDYLTEVANELLEEYLRNQKGKARA